MAVPGVVGNVDPLLSAYYVLRAKCRPWQKSDVRTSSNSFDDQREFDPL